MNLGYHIEVYHILPYHLCTVFTLLMAFPPRFSYLRLVALDALLLYSRTWWIHTPHGLLALDLGITTAGRATIEPLGYFSQIKWSSCKVFSPLPESLCVSSFFPVPSARPKKWHDWLGMAQRQGKYKGKSWSLPDCTSGLYHRRVNLPPRQCGGVGCTG